MVSHTSVTNVTARGPLALHLTTRLGPVPVNGHRNLPGYVKNGSVSENSIPSSGQELHIPDEEHSAHTRPIEDEKPSPVVEEERETVMWSPGLLCKTVSGWSEGEWSHASTLPVFPPVNWARTLPTDEAQGEKGEYLMWAVRPLFWGMMTLIVAATHRNSFTNHLPQWMCKKDKKQTAISFFFSTAISVVILFSDCSF